MKGYLDPAESGLNAHSWCVSFITVGELAKGAAMASWDLRRWTGSPTGSPPGARGGAGALFRSVAVVSAGDR